MYLSLSAAGAQGGLSYEIISITVGPEWWFEQGGEGEIDQASPPQQDLTPSWQVTWLCCAFEVNSFMLGTPFHQSLY